MPLGSLHAVTQFVHNTVVSEFGDPSFDDTLQETQVEEIEFRNVHSFHKEAVVDLEEFPWATGVDS